MATSNANIALGYGRLYIAAYDASAVADLPLDTVVKDGAWPAGWHEVGFTSGISLSVADERTFIPVDQSTMEQRGYVTSQSVELQATLMEVTLANLKYILGYGTLSTSGSTAVLGVATNPAVAEYTIGIELQAPNADVAPRRVRVARCVGMPQVEMSASREEATTFQANWKALAPPASVNAYDIRDYTD